MDNITQDDVLELIGKFPLIPTRGKLIISVNTREEDDIDLGDVGFDDVQFVIAKGVQVSSEINPGCKVLLDLDKMSRKTVDEDGNHALSIEIKPVKVNGRVFAIINDAVIDAVDNR